MPEIYAIRNDGVKFQELDLELRDVRRSRPDHIPLDDVLQFHIRNTALKSWWATPHTEFVNLTGNSTASIPDISEWVDSTLVLSPKAYRLLGDLLLSSGEFLPVVAKGETYYIFNCFIIGDVEDDKSEYEYHEDVRLGLISLEFKDSASKNLIFKTPVESCLTLFCNQRFKEIVESFELTGIQFDTELIQTYE